MIPTVFHKLFYTLTVAAAIVSWGGLAEVATAKTPGPLPESLLPYLQNPAPDGMTVCFLAQKGARDVRVLWRTEGGAEKATETAAKGTAIPGTAWTIWKARLTPLQPGAEYVYQVRYMRGEVEVVGQAYRLHAMNPHAKTFRAAFFNDIHNRVATLEAVMKNVKPQDYEMSFLLGDMWTNPSPANGADEVFRTMEAYIRLLHASEKPMIFVRGNHETIGGFAKYMAYLFDIPGLDSKANEFDQQWQFTLQPGPVWFLGLDGGDDFTKRFEKFQPIRKRQAEWIGGVLARKEGAGCWRILLTHMPLYNDNIWNSEPCRQMWEPVLTGAAIDLELGGHDHGGKLLPKGKTYEITFDGHYPDQLDPQNRKKWSYTLPWPVMIGGGPAVTGEEEGAVMLLNADEKTISVRRIGAGSRKPRDILELDRAKQTATKSGEAGKKGK
jgi:acid phosphatase type 7